MRSHAFVYRELGELAQAEVGVAGKIALLASPNVRRHKSPALARSESSTSRTTLPKMRILRRNQSERRSAPAQSPGSLMAPSGSRDGLPVDLIVSVHVYKLLEDGVRGQVLVLRFYLGTELRIDFVEIVSSGQLL